MKMFNNIIIARDEYYVGFGTASALSENLYTLHMILMSLLDVLAQDTKDVVGMSGQH